MKWNKFRIIICTMLTATLIAATVPTISAESTDNILSGEDVVDTATEELITENKELEDMEEKVYDDVETMNELGLDLAAIEGVDTSGDNIVYMYEYSDDITDEVSVQETSNSIIMNVTEGDVQNELIFKDDGDIYLDGNEVEIDIEENLENSDIIKQSTGGIKWYKKSDAPNYLKNASYSTYSQTWKVSNLNLHKSIRAIAYATIIGLLTGYTGGIIGFTSTAYWELVNYSPTSQNLSYIDRLANGSKNHRYYKCKRITYTGISYKGHSVTTFSYGVMQ